MSRIYAGELSWGGALALKCACLGAGVVFVWWAGWPQPPLPLGSMPSPTPTVLQSSTTIHSVPVDHGHKVAGMEALREMEFVQPIQTGRDPEEGESGPDAAFMVDLNEGTLAEFEHLPGIGAVLAGRIVAHRAAHGGFRRIEDLALVPGIGPKRFQQLRPFVGVREPVRGIGR